MKLSDTQIQTLQRLTKHNEGHFLQNAFNIRTLRALEKNGLVEFYRCPNLPHIAVKITVKGKQALSRNSSMLDILLKGKMRN